MSVTNPKGAVQKREYDPVGRMVHVLDFDGNDIRPVSYTHLDVYKRQLYTLTLQLAEYRLQQLRYTCKSPQQAFSPSDEDRRKAVRFLS